MKLDLKKKFKKLLDRFDRKEKVVIPIDWVKDNPIKSQVETISVSVARPRGKFRVSGLRQFKRGLAFILFLVNFAFGLTSIFYGAAIIIVLFWPTSFILADYVWKTRSV